MVSRAIFLFTALGAVAAAQTVTGTLEGRVTDASSAAVVNAAVSAVNKDTGLKRNTRTNQEGFYQLTFLPVGEYTVAAESQGFNAAQRQALVELNASRTIDFKLQPATVTAAVTVSGDAPLIEVSRGDLKSSIDEKTIEDRPLSSRNILSLVEMLPGFQTSGGYSGVNNPTLSSGSYVSFSGTGSRSASFQIDGVNNDDSSEGSSRQNVNVSAVKEFLVLTNAYPAEFGRSGGAVVLVQTKSGTNRLHGEAYEFLQNEKLNANAFFSNSFGNKPDGTPVAPRPPYRRNQFGYVVGGPIRRDRLFFFHSFEQTRLIQYNTFNRFIFLPGERIQVGDCRLCLKPDEHPNLERDRQFLQSILDRFPKVAPNNPVACDHCYTETKSASYPDQDYSGKLDYNPSSKDTLAVRYQYSRQRRKPFSVIQGESAFQNNKQQNLGLAATHMFSPVTWGEFRFGLGLRTTLVDISDGNDTPIVRISNPSPYSTTTMGSAGQFPIHRYQTDSQYNYNLSHLRGRHTWRAGIDYRRQHLDDLADNYSRGWWTFGASGVLGTASRYEGHENFLRGWVTSFDKGYGNFTTFNRLGELNQYVMDDIKVRPNLTLNLGFRWEVVLKPSERDGKILYDYGTFKKGLQPRFGLAWTPRAESRFWTRLLGAEGTTAIRAGFGLFHNRIFQSVFSQGGASLRSLPPYGVYRSFDPTFEVGDPTVDRATGKPFVYAPGFDPGRIAYASVDPGLRMPAVQQLHVTIDRQLPDRIVFSIGYTRTRGIGLLQNQSLNRARFPIVSPVNGILYDKVDPDLGNTNPAPGYISVAQPRTTFRRPDTRYSGVTYIFNGAWSYYNALRLEVKKRYSHGLHWQVSYTFGRTIDTGSDITAGASVALTELGSARSLRGLSDFHQKQRANLNFGYRLPWFKERGARNLLLG
ncbi:MAG: TonB-dependent receptor, partial [Candidatus Solibacter usitatus]|nr:TonB-dependent receptor [Candidatus Solibacter usitatus]